MALHGLDGWLALVFHPIAVGGQRCAAADSSREAGAHILFFSTINGCESTRDEGKRAGSVTESELNTPRPKPAEKNNKIKTIIKKGCFYFAITRTERDHVAHSGGTLIMLSEEDGQMLSPFAVTARHAGIELT